MDNQNTPQNTPQITYKPNIAYPLVAAFCAIIYPPLFVSGPTQVLALVFCGVFILGFITAYRGGYSLAKLLSKANAITFLVTTHVICLILTFGVAVLMHGFPFQECYSTCHTADTTTVLATIFSVSTIILAPAYYSLSKCLPKKA